MSEPTTEAGRQMLADVRASALPGSPSHDANIVYVLAIEAEAVQKECERIERQIHKDIAPETIVFRDEDPLKDPRPAVYVPLDAVLSIIRGRGRQDGEGVAG